MSGPRDRLSLRLWIHLLLLRPMLRLVFGVSAEGKDHLAGLDRFIMASNHNSHLDLPVLFSVLPVAAILRTRPVAARDDFERRPVLFSIVDSLFHPIWIVRGEPAENAIRAMQEALGAGESLVIFPEGSRGDPGEIGRFRSGVGQLAERSPDVPVVPVFVFGPERALPKNAAVPLPLWNRVVIGPPQLFGEDCADIASSLEALVRELSRSETAKRHRRSGRPERNFVLAVLGIDGSGKSTVSRRVAERLSGACRVARVSDHLEFYSGGRCTTVRALPREAARQAVARYAKTARSLERYKIPKLAELLLRDHLLSEIRRWHAPEITILDGSPLINMTAWARLYKEELHDPAVAEAALRVLAGLAEKADGERVELAKLPELRALERFGLAGLNVPDALVMLDADPGVCMRRILDRGEKVQAHESPEKLFRLREGYLMVCEVARTGLGVPACVLDGTADLDALTAQILEFLGEVRKKERSDAPRTD